jgi:6-pyruvoyltetrahydropterin/6-carboxytetrahydropterin synthase
VTQLQIHYKYVSTKEYIDEFPCAYRQFKADSHCNMIHGYSFSMKFFFGTNELDVRNWVADYGGLKELKQILKDQFDHTLLVAEDDPEMDIYKELEKRKMAQLTVLPKLGCEGLADLLYKYVNGVYIPDMWGQVEADRLWCFRVEVRETQSNMAYREGHREDNEELI